MVVKKKPTELFEFDEEVYHDLSLLKSENAEIKTQLTNHTNWLQQISTDIRSIKDSARTPWALIFSAMAILVSVMSIIGQMALGPIREELKEHKALEGHTKTLIEQARMEERLTATKQRIGRQEERTIQYLRIFADRIQRNADEIRSLNDRGAKWFERIEQ